jgi:hypothetical protein
MNDPVLKGFLGRQLAAGLELASQSDLLDLLPVARGNNMAPRQYVARFHCKGLVHGSDGDVTEAAEFHVGISFPPDYLRRAEPVQVLTWLNPPEVFHPNIRPPVICVGRIAPGTELVDLVYQCFEIITYHNWASHDALNPDAAQWARNHQNRFPVDRRPLKRRRLTLQLTETKTP